MKSAFQSSTRQPGFLYTIAIEGLPIEMEVMRPGGVYWIHCDEWDDCTLLVRQILRKASSETRGVLITTTDAAASVQRLQQTISLHDMRAFRFIEGTLVALKALTTDLDRAIRPHQRSIVIMLPAHVTQTIEHAQLRALFGKWRDWLADNECAMLIVSLSSKAAHALESMLEDNDVLAGLAHLERITDTKLIYHCAYWRSAVGVSGAKRLQLSQMADELRVHAAAEPTGSDGAEVSHPKYVVEKAALSDFGYTQESNWLVVSEREEVYALARKHSDLTAIFALSNFNQLPEIARLLHALRLERGPVIRLVVRELTSQLRLADEQKLLDCGANVVIGGRLSYTRFKSLLDNIQTVRYARQLVSSTQDLFEKQAVRLAQGVVTPDQFLAHVRKLLASEASNPTLGVLVRLTPVPGLPATQALSQIVLRRFEDVACGVGGEVYLFLHGCVPELVPVVLKQLFRLPFEEIFTNHVVFEDATSILGATADMEVSLSRMTEPEPDPQVDEQGGTASQISSGLNEPVHYSPTRIKLQLV